MSKIVKEWIVDLEEKLEDMKSLSHFLKPETIQDIEEAIGYMKSVHLKNEKRVSALEIMKDLDNRIDDCGCMITCNEYQILKDALESCHEA